MLYHTNTHNSASCPLWVEITGLLLSSCSIGIRTTAAHASPKFVIGYTHFCYQSISILGRLSEWTVCKATASCKCCPCFEPLISFELQGAWPVLARALSHGACWGGTAPDPRYIGSRSARLPCFLSCLTSSQNLPPNSGGGRWRWNGGYIRTHLVWDWSFIICQVNQAHSQISQCHDDSKIKVTYSNITVSRTSSSATAETAHDACSTSNRKPVKNCAC